MQRRPTRPASADDSLKGFDKCVLTYKSWCKLVDVILYVNSL